MSIEVGSKLEGKVTGITHFGAFIEISEGVTGLVHISEIADNYVKDVKDHLQVEDKVLVKVINVDKDGKVGLSIKQAVDKPVRQAAEASDSRPPMKSRNFRGGDRKAGDRKSGDRRPGQLSFEDKMSRFLKDSEERMSSLKKNTESKRGGRGAKRV